MIVNNMPYLNTDSTTEAWESVNRRAITIITTQILIKTKIPLCLLYGFLLLK